MIMRVFIGITLPDFAQKTLREALRPTESSRLRCLMPYQYHLTLHPPLYIRDKDALVKDLAGGFQAPAPFKIALDRIGLGPSLKAPRLIWASGPENETLSELSQQFVDLMQQWQEPSDHPQKHRPYYPHVTIARLGRRQDHPALEFKDLEINLSFEVHSVVVFESTISAFGSCYTPIWEFALAAPKF